MKKIILSVAILSLSFANAQKKEVNAAFAAVEANDISKASTQIAAAESILNGNTSLLEPEALEQYYYTKGVMLLKNGKSLEGAEYLSKINDLGKNKIYVGKNANKDKVYFVGKSAADASGISSLKEDSYQPTTSGKLGQLINPILQKASKDGLAAYNDKKYSIAGDKFSEVYYLLKATGQNNEQYLYNAALSYAFGKDMEKANTVFVQLLDSGYNGVETSYTSKNKATGEVNTYDQKTVWELSKKDPTLTDFKTETTKSIESDLYDAAVRVQMDLKKYDLAISTIEKGLKKFPNNLYLLEQKGKAYYNTGKTTEYVANLKSQLASNPKDAISWYNLGVMQSEDPATKEDAKKAFIKAAEVDPTMINAYKNLTYLMIGDDDKAIKEYEGFRKAEKMDQAKEVFAKRKERLISALPYAEKWYSLDNNSAAVISLLKSLYLTAGNEAKSKEFKAKEQALGK